ncbi:MAG: hypothetical protein WAS21_32560 [Geminicoccaceae bacterium]
MYTIIKEIGGRIMIAIIGFIAGTLAIALLRDPVQLNFVPKMMEFFGGGREFHVFTLEGEGDPNGHYRVFVSGKDEEARGRLIQVITDNDTGQDRLIGKTQSFVTVFESHDRMQMVFRPTNSKNTGGGVFIGRRLLDDDKRDVYIGDILAFTKDGDSSDCRFVRAYGVLGPRQQVQDFSKYLNDEISRDDVKVQLQDWSDNPLVSAPGNVLTCKQPS